MRVDHPNWVSRATSRSTEVLKFHLFKNSVLYSVGVGGSKRPPPAGKPIGKGGGASPPELFYGFPGRWGPLGCSKPTISGPAQKPSVRRGVGRREPSHWIEYQRERFVVARGQAGTLPNGAGVLRA